MAASSELWLGLSRSVSAGLVGPSAAMCPSARAFANSIAAPLHLTQLSRFLRGGSNARPFGYPPDSQGPVISRSGSGVPVFRLRCYRIGLLYCRPTSASIIQCRFRRGFGTSHAAAEQKCGDWLSLPGVVQATTRRSTRIQLLHHRAPSQRPDHRSITTLLR